MPLTVPPSQITFVKKFLDLPEAQFQGFLAALSSAGPHFNVDDLSHEVSGHLDLPKDMVEGMVRVLGSLYLTKDSQDISIEPFLDQDVFPALRKAETFSKDKADAQWERLRKFLVAALSLENTVGTAAKAGYVLTQHERIFSSARVLTDVRPIFHQDISEKPGSALIIHMLRMTQRDNHGHLTDEYFALDSNDIRKLRALIERAIKKEETLRGLMKDARVSVLDPKETF